MLIRLRATAVILAVLTLAACDGTMPPWHGKDGQATADLTATSTLSEPPRTTLRRAIPTYVIPRPWPLMRRSPTPTIRLEWEYVVVFRSWPGLHRGDRFLGATVRRVDKARRVAVVNAADRSFRLRAERLPNVRSVG